MNSEVLKNLEKVKDTSRITFLKELCNKHGDFKVCTKIGDWCSKWVSVMHCWENPSEIWRLEAANNRTLFPSEIVLDLDDNLEWWDVVKKLKHYDLRPFKVYHSGSRGFHIHIFESELGIVGSLFRERIRKHLIKKVGADLHLVKENHMITLENAPNAKTLVKKELIYECH